MSTCSGSRPSRHWKSAECSLSTGRIRPRPRALRGECELSGGDEALLVREREIDPALERPERGVDAREADDGVEDDVGLRALEQLGQVAADLLQRRVDVVERRRAGGGGAELELRVRLDDLDRLAADRAGGPEQRDAFHRLSVGQSASRRSESP